MRPGAKSTISLLLLLLGIWLGLRYLMPLVFPFLLGTGLALIAEPVVRLLCRKLRLPRPFCAGIGVSLAFASVALLLLLVCAFLLRELGILAGILPDLAQTANSGISLLQGWLLELAAHTPQSIQPLLEQNLASLFSGGTALLNRIFQYLLGLAGTLLTHVPDSALTLGTGLISAFMISAKLPVLQRWIRSHFPREALRPVLRVLRRVKTAVTGWLLAQCKLAGVTLVILVLGLLLLRIPYAPLWALGICLVDSLPVLGTGAILLPWSFICFLQSDNARAIGLLGVYAVITLTRSALEPKLVGRHLGLDPLVTLFALYAGYKLWGIGGMILSPLLAVTLVQFFPARETPDINP